MTGISTTLSLVDQMTAPIMSINNAINLMEDRFNALEQSTDIDASSLIAMRNQIDLSKSAAVMLGQTFADTLQNIENCASGQERLKNKIKESENSASELVSKIGDVVKAYASIRAAKGILDLSDEMTNISARLNLINDGLQTNKELQDKIFLSAQRSHSSYKMTADVISKLGIQAGRAFSSNDELIAFSEQLNRSFSIAGTSAQGVESVMYNLTQAMASGVLRGQDLNSVFSNAPNIVQNIADYLEVDVGKIRDMAAEGELSADVIKNAMLAAATATDEKFNKMPLTFNQIFTNIKNNALMRFQPILNKLNEIGNSQSFQKLVNGITSALVTLSGVATGVLDTIVVTAQFAYDNWSIIEPIIIGVATALGAYLIVLGLYNAGLAISAGLEAVSAFQKNVHAAATMLAKDATFAQTAAQYGLNAALLACPLTWIIIAIVAIITALYVGIAIMNKLANTSVSATGLIVGAFGVLVSVIANIFYGIFDIILGVVNALVNPFINFVNFLGNLFTNPISSIIYAFQKMADGILAMLQKIASAMDFVFGSHMGDTIDNWRAGLKEMADAAVSKYAPNEDYKEVISNLDLSAEKTFGIERINYGEVWDDFYTAGANLEEKVKNSDPASLLKNNIPNVDDYGSGASEVTESLNNIDDNTKGQLDYSEEELKIWRDIAERDTINRFTTAEINFDMGGITQNVNSNMDLDGIMDYIGDGMSERLEMVANGVYA